MDAIKAKEEKRKRVVLTINEKIEICRRLDCGETRSSIMKDYNIGSSTIYDIKAKRDQYMQYFASSSISKLNNNRRTFHKPKLEQLDKMLFQWLSLQRSLGHLVSGLQVREKAKEFYQQLEITETFLFSSGWLSRFKLRHGIKSLDGPWEAETESNTIKPEVSVFNNIVDQGKQIKKTRKKVNTVKSKLPINKNDNDEDDGKTTWDNVSDAFCTIIKFAEKQSCYSAKEIVQLCNVHTTFLKKMNNANLRQTNDAVNNVK